MNGGLKRGYDGFFTKVRNGQRRYHETGMHDAGLKNQQNWIMDLAIHMYLPIMFHYWTKSSLDILVMTNDVV